MNTANLQLKGILLALNAVLDALKRRGILSLKEIEDALREAEGMAEAEARERDELSKANAEAISFPIRFLREANRNPGRTDFSSVTQRVAERDNTSD